MSQPEQKTTPPGSPLNGSQQVWLLALAVGTLLPHFGHIPLALQALAALMLTWRGWLCWRRLNLPPTWLLALLTAVAGALVYLSYDRFFGRDPGMAFLACLMGLKLLEARKRRDGLGIIFLAWFLQIGLFFFSQTPITALLTTANLVLGVAVLVALHTPPERLHPQATLQLAGRLSLQALPLMLVLFLFFPRVPGPLWGMPMDAYTAESGLSDSMSPGDFGRLILSDAIAFRVRFDGPLPPRQERYWRGPVLSRFDGQTWGPGLYSILGYLPYRIGEDDSRSYRYTVTLEPHNRDWLFALELPDQMPPDSLMTSDLRLLSKTPVRSRLQYALSSRTSFTVGNSEFRRVLTEALSLPEGFNPRARALADGWSQESENSKEVLDKALNFFSQGGFRYTLEPPPFGQHNVDEFIFDARRGFCEHFSSSFVFLMRAAGVPARVVTGYQGGETNPVDGYFTVRQADAHAWAEVWLGRDGWRRVDPTATALPIRLNGGLAALPQGTRLPLMARPDMDWLRQMRWRWESLSNGWNQWILGYNPDRQKQLMERFGLPQPDWRTLTALMAGSAAVIALGLLAWALRGHTNKDPALQAWERLSRKLARLGLERRPEEGPLHWRDRVIASKPDLTAPMAEVTALYVACRYGEHPDKLPRLRAAVARFQIS